MARSMARSDVAVSVRRRLGWPRLHPARTSPVYLLRRLGPAGRRREEFGVEVVMPITKRLSHRRRLETADGPSALSGWRCLHQRPA